MEMHDGKRTCRYPQSLKAIERLFIVILIFCFAECAAGSCLSYGHSCWGAHGKRSYDGPRASQYRQIGSREAERGAMQDLNGKTTGNGDQNRWLFSRLITGRLVVPAAGPILGERLSNRWHERQSVGLLPGSWETGYGKKTNGIFRDGKEETDNSIEDWKDSRDSLELIDQFAKGRDQSADLFHASSQNEYVNNHPSLTRKFRLYKILADSFDDDALQ
ncbi:uncharacterized protein [Venturia canescens]|uniref:uncharacterized protein n=1 Tax=Venturia canescens TaxID=32260 RepID=UPI001C9C6AC8|nr:uncharacterized protein LOC122406579 [Venturia canescens]XP_043268048.1 uncharacterized protein LOC122406579 [Venturia canescens]